MKISFLVCVRNEASYIHDFLDSLESNVLADCEIIIVDDNSTDSTYNLINAYIENKEQYILVKNPGNGKIDALNCGYKFVTGDILKLVDGDDIMDKDLVNNLREYHSQYSICTHDFLMFYPNSSMRKFKIGEKFFQLGISTVMRQLKSLPKASWSFSKEVFVEIFPIPEKIPYEDIWISLRIKILLEKHSHYHIRKYLYFYRQHDSQTYGGVTNYNKNKIKWRADRNAKAAYEIVKVSEFAQYNEELRQAQEIQEFLSGHRKLNAKMIKIDKYLMLKSIVQKYLPQIFVLFAHFKFPKHKNSKY